MKILQNALIFLAIFVFFPSPAFPAENTSAENPFSPESTDFARWCPRLPTDSLMPTEEDREKIASWVKTAFSPKTPAPETAAVTVNVLRQDYGTLQVGKSSLETPLTLGTREYADGFGTHADSRILVTFPEPVTRFTAEVGVDNNHDTAGFRGSVQFAILADGQEIFRSPTRTAADEALKIDTELPAGTKQIILAVDMTEDGPSHDQADWCVPVAHGLSGKIYDLTRAEIAAEEDSPEPPFSFIYGGKPSSELLPRWKYEEKTPDALSAVYIWTDPVTGLKVSATVRRFAHFAAAEWVLDFENTGDADTPLLESVRAAHFSLTRNQENVRTPVVINTLTGDDCSENSWLPVKHRLSPGDKRVFSPYGGRPSNGAFPFWNVQYHDVSDDAPSEGTFIALGWTGQWRAEFTQAEDRKTRISAGMELISTILHPGEKFRSPRVLIMPWKTDRLSAQVLFRRLMMFEYAPKMLNGLPQEFSISGECFNRCFRQFPGWETFDGQVFCAQQVADAGCTYYWVDAGWFPEAFPNGVGNWIPDKALFPEGLGPLGDAIHEMGMKFILWFEPERVAPGTILAEEFPQYVFGGKNGGLYKLNDPEAREYMTNLLLKYIREFHLDVYRNDFNMDPLPSWRENDALDRRGMTEIRYVEGHLEMWNRFLAEIPGLWLDNCASGGRRIDLDMTAVSVPVWRSDTCCWEGKSEWDQTQTLGIFQYLPLTSACAWSPDPYTFRSCQNVGVIGEFPYMEPEKYDREEAKKAFHETKVNQKFWYGDFYPLTDPVLGKKSIHAWQVHREDLQAGLIYVFRQPECPYTSRELRPRAILPEAKYRVTFKYDYEAGDSVEMSGAELMALDVRLPEKRGCVLIQYEKCGE